MSKDIKSKKYTGVVYRELLDGSKTYFIIYKDPIEKKTKRLKIGSSKDGYNEVYCNNKRIEIISKLRLGDDTNIPILSKKRDTKQLHSLSLAYFEYIKHKVNVDNYNRMLWNYNKHLLSFCEQPINQITKQKIQKHQETKLKDGLSNGTINNIFKQLKAIYNYAIKHELYNGINPLNSLKLSNQAKLITNLSDLPKVAKVSSTYFFKEAKEL